MAPIARPGTEYRHVYLPRGTWVQYWTGRQSIGPVHALAHAPLGQPAIYVRANTPLPLWPDTTHAGGTPDPLTWLVCVAVEAPDGIGEYYDDDGDGYAFQDGRFVRSRVACRVTPDGVELELSSEGRGEQHHGRIQLDIRGVARPSQVLLDCRPTDDWEHSADWLLVRLRAAEGVRYVHVVAAPTMTAV